jgi:hypothetical protein
MALVRIDALCECEGCGKRFGIEVDTGTSLSGFSDFDAIVRQEMRDGVQSGLCVGCSWEGHRGSVAVILLCDYTGRSYALRRV